MKDSRDFSEYNDGFNAGREEGYNEGFDDGYYRAREEAEDAFSKTPAQLYTFLTRAFGGEALEAICVRWDAATDEIVFWSPHDGREERWKAPDIWS